MRVYRIAGPDLLSTRPSRPDYAECAIAGTWSKYPPCTTCGAPRDRLIEPFVVRWLPSAESVGDFSWSIGDCLATTTAAERIIKSGMSIKATPVTIEGPGPAATQASMKAPYTGPGLCLVRPCNRAKRITLGTVAVFDTCLECGLSVRRTDEGTPRHFERTGSDPGLFGDVHYGDDGGPLFATEWGVEILKTLVLSNWTARYYGELRTT